MLRTLSILAVFAFAAVSMADDTSAKKPKAAQESCCMAGAKAKPSASDEAFMAEANKMMMASQDKDACCRSTAQHPVAKGEEGCCGAKGEPAKFKVYVAGAGYKYFGCEDSAAKGRSALLSKGAKVGQVQKVNSKITIS